MKKVIFSLVLLLLASFSQASVQSISSQLYLQVSITDPTEPHTPIGRSPIEIPTIYIDGYDLLFETPCDGCTLQLLNGDGDVEYSIEIPTNTTSLALPSYLSGEYELQIIRGQFCFYGYVEF